MAIFRQEYIWPNHLRMDSGGDGDKALIFARFVLLHKIRLVAIHNLMHFPPVFNPLKKQKFYILISLTSNMQSQAFFNALEKAHSLKTRFLSHTLRFNSSSAAVKAANKTVYRCMARYFSNSAFAAGF